MRQWAISRVTGHVLFRPIHFSDYGVNQELRTFAPQQRTLSTEHESNPHLRRIFATHQFLAEGKLARVDRLGETTCTLLAPHTLRGRLDSARTPCGYSEQFVHTIAQILGSCCRKYRKFCL